MEVKQFTQGQFADTFEGSALDLITKAAAAAPAAATTTTTTTTAPVTTTTTAPVKDPLKPDMTLDQERDAAELLEQTTTKLEEDKAADEKTEGGQAAAGKDGKGKAGRPPVEKLDDSTRKLVEGLIAEKKLFGFEDGKIETKKDLQDLLDANFEHRDQTRQQDIYKQVMGSFTPAMQFIAQYANQVNSPAELLPLLQSASGAEKFASLDENNAVHQEMIVRERMRLSGDPEDVIEQEITDLKDRAKLAEKAKVYKPVVQQFYQQQTQKLIQQQQQEEQKYFQIVQQNEQNLRKILDQDQFDGLKLGKQHKGAIYELLAVPREEYDGGVGIYHIIDTLFQQGKFDRLAKIALLAADEKAFEEVMGNKFKFAAADRTIRVLNTGNRGGTPTQTDDDTDAPVVTTQQTLQRPTRNGFGFAK